MKSNLIREVVRDTKTLIDSGDKLLENAINQTLITEIAKRLNRSFRKSPKTVAAIIKYIEDHGFELRRMKCEHAVEVLENKEKVLMDISHKDLDNIRMVCEMMFAQVVKKAA